MLPAIYESTAHIAQQNRKIRVIRVLVLLVKYSAMQN